VIMLLAVRIARLGYRWRQVRTTRSARPAVVINRLVIGPPAQTTEQHEPKNQHPMPAWVRHGTQRLSNPLCNLCHYNECEF
jgi:hypothetical protein